VDLFLVPGDFQQNYHRTGHQLSVEKTLDIISIVLNPVPEL